MIIFFISLLPIGKQGLKFLEKDFINQTQIANINNIIVLAGAEGLNSTNFTDKNNLYDAAERLIAPVKLNKIFPNSKIYYVGGDGYIVKNILNEVSVAKQFYKDINFDLNKITFIGNTRNTIENLREVKKLNLENNTLLITSAFHMKRSLMIAHNIKLEVIPYAVDFRSFSNNSLLNSYQAFSISTNLRDFDLFMREIIGIFAFKIMI